MAELVSEVNCIFTGYICIKNSLPSLTRQASIARTFGRLLENRKNRRGITGVKGRWVENKRLRRVYCGVSIADSGRLKAFSRVGGAAIATGIATTREVKQREHFGRQLGRRKEMRGRENRDRQDRQPDWKIMLVSVCAWKIQY